MLKSEGSINLGLTKRISALFKGGIFYAETAPGTNKLFLVDGSILYTQLNEVVRKWYDLSLGLQIAF